MAFVLREAEGREVPVVGRLQIGRDPINQIPIDDPLASRVHATVWEDSGTLFIRDEKSSNGTFVNGKRIQETRLRPRDQIQIGNHVFQVAAAARPVQAVQPVQPGQPAQAPAGALPKQKGRGCGRWLLAGCLVLILGGCVAGVGGYLAYQGGMLTPDMVLGLVGLGPAAIEVDNFRDEIVYVSIAQLDAPADSTPLGASLDLNAFDIRTFRVGQPGQYQIDFGSSSGVADLGSCTLSVRSGDHYQFVTLPERIVINRVDDPVSVGTDLIVSTSSLCR
jgi:hypothetical protein